MTDEEKRQLVEAVITQLKEQGTDVSDARIETDTNGIGYVVAYDKQGNIVRAVPTAISSEKQGTHAYMNAYTEAGVYNINTNGGEDLPIDNQGAISARLTVLVTESDGNKVITQVLNLNNNEGGEGNVYIRSCQNGEWKTWGKLQTNIEVGQVNTLDNLTDNGIYSGVFTDGTPTSVGTFYDTFVLIVINNYAVSIPTGNPQSISQLKYSLSLYGSISVASRKRDQYGYWDNWVSLDEKSLVAEEKARAEQAEAALGKAVADEATRAEQAEEEISQNTIAADTISYSTTTTDISLEFETLDGNSHGSIILPAATTEQAGVMSAEDKAALIIKDNEEYIRAYTDYEGRFIWGIKSDGSIEFAKGVPSPIKKYVEDYVKNVDQENDEEIERINTLIQELQDTNHFVQDEEYISVVTDAEGRVIEGVSTDGRKVYSKQELFDKYDDIEERSEITLDAERKVLSYRDKDGVKHENKLHATTTVLEHLQFTGNSVDELQTALKDSGFTVKTPVDWSEEQYIHIPTLPVCALANITADAMPTYKGANIKGVMEVWDKNGNYFKKKVLIDGQGDSSLVQYKKNFAIDFCEDEWVGDETTDIKLGDWVAQDSYHFKAYYTSATKAENSVCYKLFKQFYEDIELPYMDYRNYTSSGNSTGDITQDMNTAAHCVPDGFPCIVYLNGEFYGIFAWQLKKHRDNYAMDRNDVLNIHLDGYLGNGELWGGSVAWNRFEVRNPKPKSSKWTLLCQDGTEYDGDKPKELMGVDSPHYISSNKSCVNSAETKAAITALSNYMAEIAVYEGQYNSATDKETALATLKTEIEKRFGIESLINYIILINITQNGDSTRKNWQWMTWGEINGKVKWYVMPYDCDGSFGVNSTTSFAIIPPMNILYGDGSDVPAKYVYLYYREELEARYKELRDKGILTHKNIYNLFNEWVNAIGVDNYERELEKWPDTPAYRDSNISEDWIYNGNNYITYNDKDSDWSTATSYGIGTFVKYNRRCYKSLVANNVGNNPESSANWKDVTFVPGRTYNTGDTTYAGSSNFYEFRAVRTTTDAPFSKLYSTYPREGGVYDSIYRIKKWIREKITIMDNAMNY